MCFNFYLLQQSRQGLVFGGCLILLSVIPEMPKSGIRYMSLNFLSLHFLPFFFLFFFSISPSHLLFSISMSPSSRPPFPSLLQMSFPDSPFCILPSSVLPPSSCTIRLVSLPEQLQFKRRQSCFSPSCLWSGFTLRSADEASSRKTS